MSSPQWRRRGSLTVLLALTSASTALASQGPGAGPGAASPFAQVVMAIIVYGGVALVAVAGLIGLLKRRL
jgi:hypothetical protein